MRAICYRSIMSKTPYPSAQSFPVSTNATTFGPQAVSVITPSPPNAFLPPFVRSATIP